MIKKYNHKCCTVDGQRYFVFYYNITHSCQYKFGLQAGWNWYQLHKSLHKFYFDVNFINTVTFPILHFWIYKYLEECLGVVSWDWTLILNPMSARCFLDKPEYFIFCEVVRGILNTKMKSQVYVPEGHMNHDCRGLRYVKWTVIVKWCMHWVWYTYDTSMFATDMYEIIFISIQFFLCNKY